VKPAARTALAIAAAGAASAAYQRVAEMRDRRRYPAPGELVDIGEGRKMHVLVEGNGEPPVVIIPALGANVLEWVRVLHAASAETTVCTYDRAGLGWSDQPRGPTTIDGMADDLHALLKCAGITPPYIIAGHSMGGIVARRFRSRYPAAVAGMLLIDSSHEIQVRRFSGGRDQDILKRAARRQVRILGLRRLGVRAGVVGGFDAASLNRETVPEYAGAAKAVSLTAKQRRAVVRELLLLARPQGQPQHLGDLPLTVLSAGNAKRRQWADWATWCELQDELAALSSRSAHMYALNADHLVQLDDPGVVGQAITDLVRQYRGDRVGQRAAPGATAAQRPDFRL
jgi:pimeloyl-ACP methyl ester carboxylesterase